MQNRRFASTSSHDHLALFLGVCLVSLLLIYHLTHQPPAPIIPLPPWEEVIHLVYMLGGNSYSRHLFHTHLKSLLAFSNSSLHLHVIADYENIEDVRVLLDTWRLPRCNYTFYDEKDYTARIPRVPHPHYSMQFGYLKLELPYIIKHTDKILVLDVDIVAQVDVKKLWDRLGYFNSTNFFGMVHTTSGWYTLGRPGMWPAVGTGFNSGVILMDLWKMRNASFDQAWRESFKRNYAIVGSNPIADQDILNAWVKENPETFQEIPCPFNYEVGGGSRQKLCLLKPLLIHFNTPTKKPNRGLERFADIRKIYAEMDGDLLALNRVENGTRNNEPRILPNAYGRRPPSNLCWGTHLGAGDLEIFLEHADLWSLPIAVVLYGSDKEVNTLSESLSSLNRTDITVHSMFGSNISPDHKYLRKFLMDNTNCEEFLISHVGFDFVGDLGSLLKSSTMGRNATEV